jgi:hypothetical protein
MSCGRRSIPLSPSRRPPTSSQLSLQISSSPPPSPGFFPSSSRARLKRSRHDLGRASTSDRPYLPLSTRLLNPPYALLLLLLACFRSHGRPIDRRGSSSTSTLATQPSPQYKRKLGASRRHGRHPFAFLFFLLFRRFPISRLPPLSTVNVHQALPLSSTVSSPRLSQERRPSVMSSTASSRSLSTLSL